MEKSIGGIVTERVLKLLGIKKIAESDNFLQRRFLKNEKIVKPPTEQFLIWKKTDFNKFYYYSTKGKSDILIFYFHGGSFVCQPIMFHWRFLAILKKKTDATIIFPIYPKAPKYDYKRAYSFLFKVYKKVLRTFANKKIVFMGDSAGGNIALSFAEQLKKANLKTPDKIIMISPCVDLTLSNKEITLLDKKNIDPMLSKKALVKTCMSWANGDNLSDYKLSPINGDFKDIGEISVFSGTNEILYPDAKLFDKVAKERGANINFVERENMLHAYLLHPIKEAKSDLKLIIKLIKN